MASFRVVGTEKEPTNRGGAHAHIAALCLEDERRLTKHAAIARLKVGLEDYYTYEGGMRAELEVVERCPQCASEYLRTSRHTVTRNDLLALPDC